jgi:putative hydrolase of the HAD superfamily
LRDNGYTLPPEADALNTAWAFTFGFWGQITNHYDPKALKVNNLVRLLAAQWGIEHLQNGLVDTLAPAYMRAIQANVYPLDGAADVLKTLRDRGLRIGLISNTVWPGSYHLEDLEQHGLIPYIEHMIFSADAEMWKPYPAIFQLALEGLNLKPEEAAFVGDTLYFDVWGAQQTGLRGVWIEYHQRAWTPDGIQVTPDAVINRLSDLLPIVERWQQS